MEEENLRIGTGDWQSMVGITRSSRTWVSICNQIWKLWKLLKAVGVAAFANRRKDISRTKRILNTISKLIVMCAARHLQAPRFGIFTIKWLILVSTVNYWRTWIELVTRIAITVAIVAKCLLPTQHSKLTWRSTKFINASAVPRICQILLVGAVIPTFVKSLGEKWILPKLSENALHAQKSLSPYLIVRDTIKPATLPSQEIWCWQSYQEERL